jgi:hypothetical protein
LFSRAKQEVLGTDEEQAGQQKKNNTAKSLVRLVWLGQRRSRVSLGWTDEWRPSYVLFRSLLAQAARD